MSAAILGGALLVWSADANAHVANPVRVPTVPSWWAPQGELLSLLPRAPLEPLDLFALSGPQLRERWYEGEAEADRSQEATELTLPCGLFLDGEPRLTLFDDPHWWEPPAAAVVAAWHTDKQGEIIEYDQIPRRWDRPLDYDAYRYPVVGYPGWATVTSGYDLDLPDVEQRRGTMRAVGHGGLDLPQARGTKVTLIPLAQQLGDAKVIHVGTLFGNSVVTLHAVREGGERRNYLLIFGHLDSAAPGLLPGQMLPAGGLVGFVGNSESDFVHLHLEVRRVRDGVDPATLTGYRVLARDATIVTDPRNVLPTKPARSLSCKEQRLAQRRAALFDDLHLSLER
jgi:murein DD-endopeptidase MepM/ murein hydrolase activator NlpD